MYIVKNILIYILCFPIAGMLILTVVPSREERLIKLISLNFACFSFAGALFLWGCFNKSVGSFQFVTYIEWIPLINFQFILGIDGISIFFLILTTLLVPICILNSWNSVNHNIKEFFMAFLLLDFLLIGVFCVLDLLLFYIFFESILIPMFLIIGIWGSRDRKILASYYFFLYTFLGSVLMLLSILYIHLQIGSTSYQLLLSFSFSEQEQKILWITFFIAFASKVPMLPVHLWLPEAHVEAPTAGSVLLAGILLKLGTYGFIRYSLPMFPKASIFFAPFVYTIAVVGIIYTSLTAIRQTDFKRIIAYTSIAHMNLVVIGIFSLDVIGIEGAVFQCLSHGFVASALFLIIGVVYDRYKTRIVQYYGGLASVMPIFSAIFLFFTLANIALPGTSSFIGEYLILTGSFKVNSSVTFLSATGMVIGGAYSLWLLNRIVYGNLKTQHTEAFLDLSLREFLTFLPLILGALLTGIWPSLFLTTIHCSVNNLVELLYF